jgi:hypothetical protein
LIAAPPQSPIFSTTSELVVLGEAFRPRDVRPRDLRGARDGQSLVKKPIVCGSLSSNACLLRELLEALRIRLVVDLVERPHRVDHDVRGQRVSQHLLEGQVAGSERL